MVVEALPEEIRHQQVPCTVMINFKVVIIVAVVIALLGFAGTFWCSYLSF